MEVVGLIASAAQISVYACSIASLITEIRQAARNGPLLLRERSQQLKILSDAVEKIRQDYTLHTDVLSEYLMTIQDKICVLHNLVRLRSQRRTNSSAQRLRTALAFVTRNKEVETGFASLQAHCQTLYFYMDSQNRIRANTTRRREQRDEELLDRGFYPPTSDPSEKVTEHLRDRQAQKASAMLAPESQANATPVQEPSTETKSQRFIGNKAGENSRHWLGNHADAHKFKDQVFEQNIVERNGDQVLGNSLFPPERNPGRTGTEKGAGSENDAVDHPNK